MPSFIKGSPNMAGLLLSLKVAVNLSKPYIVVTSMYNIQLINIYKKTLLLLLLYVINPLEAHSVPLKLNYTFRTT